MRYGLIPESILDRALLSASLVPAAMTEGYAPLFGRAVVLATELGIWDRIGHGSADADQLAGAAGTDPSATRKLLDLLVTMRYLERVEGGYRNARHVRRWLLADAPSSVRDAILMKRLEWRWIDGMDDYLRSGRPLDVHRTMTAEDWGLYQRGMRAQANAAAPLVARSVPVPKGATTMLDIGGSHGYFSVALCRRHPGLTATVLDLPEAVEHAAPLLAREEMGDRVQLRAGDALADDLGEAEYDLVFMFSLVHHFDDATNRRLVASAARALRPGGVMVIGEVLRPQPGNRRQLGAFFDLYFGLTSESGTWSFDEMGSWQRDAGLVPRRPQPLRFASEIGLQVGDKL
ncbi:MAG TPA: class I SAM-dependent methyltransferase [Candidatus Limnocylindria bacterium]